MTANPFERHRSTGGFSGEMRPGESRTFIAGERTITVIRSDRPYAHDLADAYNAAMPESVARTQIWVVGQEGSIKLVTRTAPVDPRRWEPEPGEMDWIKKATAEFLKRYPPRSDEPEGEIKLRLSRTMDRWHAAKPWRQTGEAA